MTGADVRAGKPGRYLGNWKPICLRLVIDIKQPIMDAGAGAMQVWGWNLLPNPRKWSPAFQKLS